MILLLQTSGVEIYINEQEIAAFYEHQPSDNDPRNYTIIQLKNKTYINVVESMVEIDDMIRRNQSTQPRKSSEALILIKKLIEVLDLSDTDGIENDDYMDGFLKAVEKCVQVIDTFIDFQERK